ITVAIAKPVVTQVISWSVAPTAPRMWGSATFTIDALIAPMSVPNVTEIVTSHLFVAGRAGAAAGKVATAVLIARPPAGTGPRSPRRRRPARSRPRGRARGPRARCRRAPARTPRPDPRAAP